MQNDVLKRTRIRTPNIKNLLLRTWSTNKRNFNSTGVFHMNVLNFIFLIFLNSNEVHISATGYISKIRFQSRKYVAHLW
jgi:hypothetical protein